MSEHGLGTPELVAGVWSTAALWRTVPLTCDVWPKSGSLASEVIAPGYMENSTFLSTWLKDIFRIQN